MTLSAAARRLKIIFAGTPDFAASHLQSLLTAGASVAAVYCQPDRPAGRGKKLSPSPVKQLASSHGLPVLQPQSLKDSASQADFAALDADVFVVVAYGLLIPQAVLNLPTHGCINVHASLLPRWRGAAPIQRAIEAGDTETGITIMQMDVGLDTGDMLRQVTCPISDTDTGGTLHARLAELGPAALLQTLNDIAEDAIQPEKQDDRLSCYAAKIAKAEAAVDWHQDAATIERKIRAFNPFPVAWSQLDDKVIRIWSATKGHHARGETPGTIVRVTGKGIEVACRDGSIIITHAQLPGKKSLAVADILRGQSDLFSAGKTFIGHNQ
jgi:methionyl-tRNA formyltransferase